MTAPDLARELEVSVRTVYRDMESLSSAGVPVYSDRGPRGGYQLVEGYRTQLTGLTPDEADAIFLGALPEAAAQLGLGTVMAAAQLKVLAALPPELRARASRLQERFHLDPGGWFKHPEPVPHLPVVAAAVWDQERVAVRYQRWQGEVERVLEPLGVVSKGDRWYVVARAVGGDSRPSQERTYRVARLRSVVPTGERFERPEGFDLVAAWNNWSDRFESSMFTVEAVVRLSPGGRRLAAVVLQPNQARAVRDRAGPPDGGGWVTVAIPIESVSHGLHALLQLGADAEVLAPPELRAAVVASAAEVVALYGGTAPVGDAPRRTTAGGGDEAT